MASEGRPVRVARRAGAPDHALPVPASEAVDDGVLAELGWFFRGVDSFPVRFTSIGRFEHEGVVFVRPDSDDLVQMARALARRWPECPPYRGRIPIDDVVPHLTIVQTDDRALRRSAANAVSPGLPFSIIASATTLWVQGDDGEWSERATFPLGPPE